MKNDRISVVLDGVAYPPIPCTADKINVPHETHGDYKFCQTNWSNSGTFKGAWKSLEVMSDGGVPNEVGPAKQKGS